jgi:hypothetical protein
MLDVSAIVRPKSDAKKSGPLIQPWREFAALCENLEMRNYLFGSYYICRAVKPPAEPATDSCAADIGALDGAAAIAA